MSESMSERDVLARELMNVLRRWGVGMIAADYAAEQALKALEGWNAIHSRSAFVSVEEPKP